MTTTVSITESNLFTALRAFLLSILTCPVIRSQQNRAAMPQGDFVTMTPLFLIGLSTDKPGYTDPGTNPGIQSHTRSTQWHVQLDFYGPDAANNAAIVSTLIRTEFACDAFTASGVDMQPLYAGDPKQAVMIDSEQQFQNRWTMDFIAQFNPVIQTSQDFAAALEVTLADVDVRFPH